MHASDATNDLLIRLEGMFSPEGLPYQLHEPELTEVEKASIAQVLDEGFVSYAGRQVDLFEEALAKEAGAAHAVAMVSGTAALHAVLMALGIGPGDEVLCPSLTFIATANAVSHAGATPHFVDCSPENYGVDAVTLAAYLKKVAVRENGITRNRETGRRIAAVLPVHVLGHMADMAALMEVADSWSLKVIEDSAESLGSRRPGGAAGVLGTAAVLSFNGNKIVTTGGGGAVLTDDEALAKDLRHLTTTAKCPHPWRFFHDAIGYNYRLPNLNAALGLAQLERLDDMLARKRRLAAAYGRAFADSPFWAFLKEPDGAASNYWLNAALARNLQDVDLDATFERLHKAGYKCRPFWDPLHRLPIYAGCPRAELPVTENLAKRAVCLPSSPKLMGFLRHE